MRELSTIVESHNTTFSMIPKITVQFDGADASWWRVYDSFRSGLAPISTIHGCSIIAHQLGETMNGGIIYDQFTTINHFNENIN